MEEAKGCNEDATIKATKLEMRGVREENTRLKNELRKIEKDYKTLQMQFTRESQKKNEADNEDQERELVSLRLGTNSTTNIQTDLGLGCSPERTKTDDDDGPARLGKGPSPSPGPDNSHSSTGKKEEASKVLKTQRDEEISQTSVKRARVCVRARCDTPTMNDGCQWRKYGQKIAKGNPCPRAYYRCTVSTSCPVRKQVQRCMQDMSILITTYEGTHNHPLPISAAAMASTTSAAASMMVSGSSTSPPLNLRGTTPFHYNHLSFSPNYSATTTPFSTVTLDLTTNPAAAAAAAHGGFSLYPPQNPRIPTAGPNGFPNYSNAQSAHEQKYLSSYLEKLNQASSQQALTETLTKAITSDPSFRSVIAAAISTMAAANGGAGEKY